METLNFEYEARRPLTRRAHVGVVGSGDLEVLIEPSPVPAANVRVRTSVDGYAQVWKQVLDRFFDRPAAADDCPAITILGPDGAAVDLTGEWGGGEWFPSPDGAPVPPAQSRFVLWEGGDLTGED